MSGNQKENFDFLNFDITGNHFQAVTPDEFPLHAGAPAQVSPSHQQIPGLDTNSQRSQQHGQQQQQQQQYEHPFLDDLDNFGLTPGINVIEEEEDSNDTPTPLQFEQANFIDLSQDLSPNHGQQQQQQQQQAQSAGLAQSYASTGYGASYNNLSFNNNGNNLISPNDFSDFDNSPYSSSFQHGDSLKSPPTMNSPTFSPSSSLSTSVKNLSKEEKLRRRREFHNAVERRRRDLIKDRIKELGQLIPPSLLFEAQFNKDGKEITKESRANKSIILNKTVEYILNLQSILASQDERLDFLKAKFEELGG